MGSNEPNVHAANLQKSLTDAAKNLSTLAGRMPHMAPNQVEIDDIQKSIDELNGKVNAIANSEGSGNTSHHSAGTPAPGPAGHWGSGPDTGTISSPLHSSAGDPNSQIRDASIRFHTNDEDKDHDTHVTVAQIDGTVVAEIDNDFGHFNDQSDNGPFFLNIIDPATTRSLLEQGTALIRIDPNGHDTWRFNFSLDFRFDDDSHLGAQATNLQLSQNNQEQSFGIN